MTINPGVHLDKIRQEVNEEARLLKKDEAELAQLQGVEEVEQFDEVKEKEEAEGEGEEKQVKVIKRVRLPRVAKPVGDVFDELLKQDLGVNAVKTLKTVNENEVEK